MGKPLSLSKSTGSSLGNMHLNRKLEFAGASLEPLQLRQKKSYPNTALSQCRCTVQSEFDNCPAIQDTFQKVWWPYSSKSMARMGVQSLRLLQTTDKPRWSPWRRLRLIERWCFWSFSFILNSFLFIFWKIIFLFEGKNILLKGKVQYNPIEI